VPRRAPPPRHRRLIRDSRARIAARAPSRFRGVDARTSIARPRRMRLARLVLVIGSVLAGGCFSVGGCEGTDECPGHAIYSGWDFNLSECGCPLSSDVRTGAAAGQPCTTAGVSCTEPDTFASCRCVATSVGGPAWSCGTQDLSAPQSRLIDLSIVDGSGGD
jgi:hypothetical protein